MVSMNNVAVAVAGLALWTRQRLFGKRNDSREYIFGIFLINGGEGYRRWLFRHRNGRDWRRCCEDTLYFTYVAELVEDAYPGFDRNKTGNLLINGLEDDDISGMIKSFLR